MCRITSLLESCHHILFLCHNLVNELISYIRYRIPSERDLYSFIVCTLELLSVKLLDTGIDDVQLRLAYSMAIIRFLCLAFMLIFSFEEVT